MEEMFMDRKPDKEQVFAGLIVVLILLFVLGLILVLASTSIGLKTAQAEIQRNGGSMDTAMYQYILNSAAESYRIAGAILALISGVGILLAGMESYRKRKSGVQTSR